VLDDFYRRRDRARLATQRNDFPAAAEELEAAAAQVHIAEVDYVSALEPLVGVYEKLGEHRRALTVEWYLAVGERLKKTRLTRLFPEVPAVDRARTLAFLGDMLAAGSAMEEAGLVAAAAIFRERAADFGAARALWSRLLGQRGGVDEPYVRALVAFNLARCARQVGDFAQSREALVQSVGLLEEAADAFESMGQRERAFDCFQVLVAIGRESGAFEHVLEGYVNCIRILREDHLKYFALQYMDDAIGAARAKTELTAAATLAREASEYARTIGLPKVGAYYMLSEAQLFLEVAKRQREKGAAPEMAESALLAAVHAFGEMGQFARVGRIFEELALLPLEEKRREHYARASQRYVGVRDEVPEAEPIPAHLRQKNQFPDVWHGDVLEAEQAGSAAEACADVLLDARWPDLLRRKAMLARLTALGVEGRTVDAATLVQGRVRLATELAQLHLYMVLAPLEKLYAIGERETRLSVLRAMKSLDFKRTFVTLRAALREPDQALVAQAAEAVEGLRFLHAFDPLARIVREAPQVSVRAAALRALARIDATEPAEFLLGVLEHGAPSDRAAAKEALLRAPGLRFVELAQAAAPSAGPQLRASLDEILRARGYS
jgi:hypothetical protein